jgi:hypothetical protein
MLNAVHKDNNFITSQVRSTWKSSHYQLAFYDLQIIATATKASLSKSLS